MWVDPGPPTQLRAQNAKGKNDNKVRRAGPPRTQLRQKIERRKTVLILCKTLGGPADLRTLLILVGPPMAQNLFVSLVDPAQKHFVSSVDPAQKLFASSEDPMNLVTKILE